MTRTSSTPSTWVSGYASAQVFLGILEAAGEDLTPESFQDAASDISIDDSVGGPVSFPEAKTGTTGCYSLVQLVGNEYEVAGRDDVRARRHLHGMSVTRTEIVDAASGSRTGRSWHATTAPFLRLQGRPGHMSSGPMCPGWARRCPRRPATLVAGERDASQAPGRPRMAAATATPAVRGGEFACRYRAGRPGLGVQPRKSRRPRRGGRRIASVSGLGGGGAFSR